MAASDPGGNSRAIVIIHRFSTVFSCNGQNDQSFLKTFGKSDTIQKVFRVIEYHHLKQAKMGVYYVQRNYEAYL